MSIHQTMEKMANTFKVDENIFSLWSEFHFGNKITDIVTAFRDWDIVDIAFYIMSLIVSLIKFLFTAVLLLEHFIEMALLAYGVVLLTAAMPALISIPGSALLFAAGAYILVFNDSSNILHGFMPAFLRAKIEDISAQDEKENALEVEAEQAPVEQINQEVKDLVDLPISTILLKLSYLAIRLVLVAASFSFLVLQLHNVSFVAQLLMQSDKILPALKLVGGYLMVLCSGLAISEAYAKISSLATSSKETKAVLLAVASLMSILFAVPLSAYTGFTFLGVILPTFVVNVGIIRTSFVASMHVAAGDFQSAYTGNAFAGFGGYINDQSQRETQSHLHESADDFGHGHEEHECVEVTSVVV